MMCVLSVLSDTNEAFSMMQWSALFAKSLDLPLLLLCALPAKEDHPPKAIPLDEAQENTLLEAARQALLTLNLPNASLWSLRQSTPIPSVAEFAKAQKTRLLVLGALAFREEEREASSLEQQLFAHISSDILLLRLPSNEQTAASPDALSAPRVLLPVSHSEHSRAALQMAAALGQQNDAMRWKTLLVHDQMDPSESSEENLIAGQQRLEQALKKAGVHQAPHLSRTVVVHSDIPQTILQEAKLGYDLVLVGASKKSNQRHAVFGQIQKRLFQEQPQTAVGVLYASPPPLEIARNRLVHLLSRIIPQMAREDRVALFTYLQEGSHASFNFLALISLSTAIAALGLLQNSVAVVIGAMLVAPLMTPMLGAGLALVQGNLKLAKNATLAIVTGFFSSLAIGISFGLIVPGLADLTPEILARATPNLLDLAIALLSGTAAAYALTQTSLMAALPGVAIAAALVPPIASVGISIAHGRFSVALGAAFLFFTNLIAIILASAITFYLVGVRPDLRSDKPRRWARILLLTLTSIAFLIAFPLSAPLLQTKSTQERQLQQKLRQFLQPNAPDILLHNVSLTTENRRPIVHIDLSSSQPLSEKLARHLTKIVHQILPRPPTVRIRTSLLWRSSPPRTATPPSTTQPSTTMPP